MKYALLALKVVVFLLLFGFAMHNSQTVTMNLFLGYAWNTPLIVLVLVFFVAGALFGLLASLVFVMRVRRELLALKRELRHKSSHAPEPVQPLDGVVTSSDLPI
ncbi:LapA family protein [Leeia oryzae]|uniref:LapA family protein n=1 Tax=Leeia oryzae TaxID=356662 RepID=UPI000381089D|nr:LapA family protein [Leeia oryzae]